MNQFNWNTENAIVFSIIWVIRFPKFNDFPVGH